MQLILLLICSNLQITCFKNQEFNHESFQDFCSEQAPLTERKSTTFCHNFVSLSKTPENQHLDFFGEERTNSEFSFKKQLEVSFFDEYHSKENLSPRERKCLEKIEANYNLLIQKSAKEKIPKTFHIIWLEPNPFPKNSIRKLKHWKKLHPSWKFKFWTTSKSSSLPMKNMERCLISKLSMKTPGSYLQEDSSLLKYEILFEEGGVYLDHDVKCLKSIDPLCRYDFFAPLEPLHENSYDRSLITIGAFVIGSVPKNNILKNTLLKISQTWDGFSQRYPQDNLFFSYIRSIGRISIPFTTSVLELLTLDQNNLVLPPLSFFAKQRPDWKDLLNLDKKGEFIYGNYESTYDWNTNPIKGPSEVIKNSKNHLFRIKSILDGLLIIFSLCFLILLTKSLLKTVTKKNNPNSSL